MYGRIPDHLPDLPPLDFFPPSPEAERMPNDLTEREEWLKAEMAKVQTEKGKLQKAHAPIEMRPVNSAKAFLTSLPPHPDEASKPTTLDAASSSTPPSSFQQLPELLNLCMAMPQRKVPKFDGNPLNYWKFSRGFTSGVAQYVTDPANRLAFLIDACEGEAREAIDHCTILEPEHGYSEAWKILSRRFGNPSVISKEYIASITNGPPIRPNDAKALLKLADTMKACWLVLSQLNYSSELNTRTTIGAVLNRLPQTIQLNWFDRASEILRANREPSFADLTEYVQGRADSLSIRESYLPNVPRPITDRGERQRTYNAPPTSRVSTLATRLYDTGLNNNAAGSTQRPCVYCSGVHYLDECPQFLRLRANSRIDFVRSATLCELCLKPRHDAKQCHSRRNCGLNSCGGLHHPLLHMADPLSQKTEKDVHSSLKINCVSGTQARTSVALAVLPVTIHGPAGSCQIYALLDSGSDSTMLQEDVAAKLGLSGSPANINVATLNSQNTIGAVRVKFDLETSLPTEKLQPVNAWTMPALPSITQISPASRQWSNWKHLADIPFETNGSQPISLLIGMDVPVAHWVLESRIGRPADPYAVRTPLGWVLLGPLNDTGSTLVKINHLSSCAEDDLVSRVETMFNIEFKDPPTHKRGASREDEQALSLASSSLRLINGQYEIALPWKNECPNLPSNYLVARNRLYSLGRRLKKDERLRHLYNNAMNDYFLKGYAEPIDHDATFATNGQTWYLPHHPVVHPHKPNKVRVVFDCACQVRGTSLNSQLLTGPDIVNSLLGVLLRFRQYPYVATADIESMFHQVRVPEANRDVLRFLWWELGDIDLPPKVYRMTVHPFGATSSPFCASLALRQALKENSTMSTPAAFTAAAQAFYVDDLLYSADSPRHLSTFVSNLKEALTDGGFHLTKWSTNAPDLLAQIPVEERAQRNLDLDLQPSSWHRTLGVQWDMATDEFLFQVDNRIDVPTKRKMLSHIASLYDPMGFVCPALLPGRLLFQQLCRLKVAWDEKLTSNMVRSWRKWRQAMVGLTSLRIPRCFSSKESSSEPYELHCFSDASEQAYGAVLYLRTPNVNRCRCYFVWGKSRVAPLKAVTIPRLELTAALLSARMALQAREELSLTIRAVTFWTDSMIVLQTLRNTTTRFQSFVANRKAAINELTEVEQWRYVDTLSNPADIASRGLNPDELSRSVWITGPPFLYDEEHLWPIEPDPKASLPVEWTRKNQDCTVTCTQSSVSWLDRFSRYDSWIKLLRGIVWLSRFCEYIKKRTSLVSGTNRFITREELLKASLRVVKLTQATAFSGEFSILTGNPTGDKRALNSSASPLRKLNPFNDNGVLRVGGRLRWAALPYEAKHPVILPRNHYVTKLIIRHYHEKYGHVGAGQVLAAVRSKYWVLQGHAAVKGVLSTCHHCRRWFSLPCNQIMAPLPAERTHRSHRPFEITGVDYFGPLLVKRGRGTEKRYGCLFTCMNVRAVHLEVAHTLDTNSFLCAFSRFVARRGSPIKLYSDNGTNFRGAEADVRQCLRNWHQDRIASKLLEQECDWVFSVPKASHRGGVWERQIRSVRRILRAMLGERLVDDETLLTVLTEIEKILNDRPLVKLTSDPNDYAALTPNHLLLLQGNPTTQPATDSRALVKGWRHANHLADIFWNRWIKEYLPTLQTISKWLKQGKNLKKGDLVLLGDVSTSRGQWQKGIVERAVQSGDGAVREALVRTIQGTFRRDVRQLYLLEAYEEDESGLEDRSNKILMDQ